MIFKRKNTINIEDSIFSNVSRFERCLEEQKNLDISKYERFLEDYRSSVPRSYAEVFDNVAPNIESATIASAIIIGDEDLSVEQRGALHMVLIEHWNAKTTAEALNG